MLNARKGIEMNIKILSAIPRSEYVNFGQMRILFVKIKIDNNIKKANVNDITTDFEDSGAL